MTLAHRFIDSPLGPILLSVDASGRLTGVRVGRDPRPGTGARPDHLRAQVLDDIAAQLGEYFEGRRRSFDVTLAMEGSSFQHLVWSQLRQIPFATTVSYGQLASQLGRPGAARAVGHANARNPIAIIVPCHRVIGSSGDLTGYGGGLEAKRHLLDLEVGHDVADLEVGHDVAPERPRTHRRGPPGTVGAHRAS